MGYRSDVAAVFYVSKAEHLPLLKLWLSENFPMDKFHDSIRWFNKGMVVEEKGIKWYEDYDEVKAFNKAAENFTELVDDFDRSPSENDKPAFCYEFVRVGESYDDIEVETHGDRNECLLEVNRTIRVEV